MLYASKRLTVAALRKKLWYITKNLIGNILLSFISKHIYRVIKLLSYFREYFVSIVNEVFYFHSQQGIKSFLIACNDNVFMFTKENVQ